MDVPRRRFLQVLGVSGVGLAVPYKALALLDINRESKNGLSIKMLNFEFVPNPHLQFSSIARCLVVLEDMYGSYDLKTGRYVACEISDKLRESVFAIEKIKREMLSNVFHHYVAKGML